MRAIAGERTSMDESLSSVCNRYYCCAACFIGYMDEKKRKRLTKKLLRKRDGTGVYILVAFHSYILNHCIAVIISSSVNQQLIHTCF